MNPFPGLLEIVDLRRVRDGLEVEKRIFVAKTLKDSNLLSFFRVSKLDLKEKAIKLSLRQGKCPFEFYRILGRHDKERMRKRICLSVHGDLAFFHTLKKTGLSPGNRA